MRKPNSLIVAACGVVLVANAIALVHAARNRKGIADAEITLTEKELSYWFAGPEDTGISLGLLRSGDDYTELGWSNEAKLRSLGFDCSMPPDKPLADEFYKRQRPIAAFAAFEYNGPHWLAWLEANRPTDAVGRVLLDPAATRSRLVVIDVDRSAGALRDRYPDRSSVMILPVVTSIWRRQLPTAPGGKSGKVPFRLAGILDQVPSRIHVQRPFSDAFLQRNDRTQMHYRVKLRFGAFLEPQVTAVEFLKPTQ